MRPTLRRLNDRERYWGLTWPAWAAATIGGGLLYGVVRVSPLGVKPTVTIVVLVVAAGAMVVAGVSGQALSPARQLRAIIAYRRSPKQWLLAEADERGLVLSSPPDLEPEEPSESGRLEPLVPAIDPESL